MKHYLKITTLLFFVFSTNLIVAQEENTSAQDYLNSLTQIYDSNFEQALIDLGYDNNLDGFVKTVNIENITELNVANKNISNLTGIEKFTALQKLFCQNNNLEFFNVSSLSNLEELNCANNNLKTLNVTRNNNLIKLYCNHNVLSYLNLIINTNLTTIECHDNNLKYLNLKGLNNINVESFKSHNNINLTKIDVNNLNSITTNWQKDANTSYIQNRAATCSNEIEIPDANFRNILIALGFTFNGNFLCIDTEVLDADTLYLGGLGIADLSGIEAFTSLLVLDCYNNLLTSLDVSNNIDLERLYCPANNLTSLDVSNNTNLTELQCYNNNLLTSLDVSNNIDLDILHCSDNNLTSLDVSNNTNLTQLYCHNNLLTSLDVSNNIDLDVLYCSANNLTSLDVSNNIDLDRLYCSANNLTSLDLRQNTDLGRLDCENNQLTSLDIRNTQTGSQHYEAENNNLCYALVSSLSVALFVDPTTTVVTTPELGEALPCATPCENPDAEYGYNFDTNELVITLHYDDPLQYELVNQWTIEWGNYPSVAGFLPGTQTEVGSQVTNGPMEPDASGNYIIRIGIPYNQIYDVSTHHLKYRFHILTSCSDSNSSNWSDIINNFKYFASFECVNDDSVRINFHTLTQPISQFQIKYGPQGFNPSLSESDLVAIGGGIIKTPFPPPSAGPESIIISNLLGIDYDFYIQRIENVDTSHEAIWGYNLIPYSFNVKLCAGLDICNAPTNFEITESDTDSLTFNWIDIYTPDASQWEIEYGLTGFTQGNGTVIAVNGKPFTLNNIDYNSEDYDFYIRTVCKGEFSDWTGPILSGCHEATGLEHLFIGNSATLTWIDESNPTFNRWTIAYGNAGFSPDNNAERTIITVGNDTPFNVTHNSDDGTYSVIINGLDLSSFQFYVQRHCFCVCSGCPPGTGGPGSSIGWVGPSEASNGVCVSPQDIESTITDTTVFLSWTNGNISSEPTNGWEIRYALADFIPEQFDEDPSIGQRVFTNAPELIIEDLIPSNAYDFWVRSLCSNDSSDWVQVHLETPCSNCTSFIPQVGKEYVVSAWVKENWTTQPRVEMNPSLVYPNNHIKMMLNDLIGRYTTNSSSGICPNGTVVDGLRQMNYLSDINDLNSPFHPELLQIVANGYTESGNLNIDDNNKPAIYNFQYYEDNTKSEFRFQYTQGEYHWTENLVVNPGAELVSGINGDQDALNWSTTPVTPPMQSSNGSNSTTRHPHSGERFFYRHSPGSDWFATQDISLDNYLINNGNCTYDFEGYMWRWDSDRNEDPIMVLYFIGVNDDIIASGETVPTDEDHKWEKVGFNGTIPPGTKTIRIKLFGRWIKGDDNNSLFDDISLKINYPTFDTLSPIQTFDVDCYINGGYIQNATSAVTDPGHYPLSNYYYNLEYPCNDNIDESTYKYRANVYRSTNFEDSINLQVSNYNKTSVQIKFLDNNNSIVGESKEYGASGEIIDGWQRIQGVFKVPLETVKVKIELVNKHLSDAYFDDIRIFPKVGNMKSFVYDQKTQRLMAELDENNYATFYEYDKEGGLIRVKKETEKGIFTIQETRSGNIKKE